MPECVINTRKSLDDIIILLNRFLLQADKYQRLLKEPNIKDHSNAKTFSQSFKNIKKQGRKKTDENFYNYIEEMVESFGNHYKSTSGWLIFDPNRKIEPVYGIGKPHQAYFNENLIIGASFNLHEQSKLSYRVDFSPDKGLHINFTLNLWYNNRDHQFHTREYALIVKPESKRYNIIRDGLNNDAILELMQFKFFAKITLDYLRIHPQKINTKQPPKTISEVEGYNTNIKQNIMWFLQREPFYINQLLDYLKQQIYTKEEDAAIAGKIVGSLSRKKKNKQLFVNTLVAEKVTRHIIVDVGATLFKKANDETKARLFAEDVSVDSEQDRTITENSL